MAERPMNLQLTRIKFPVTAIASIGHRFTGVLLFFFIPFVLWALGYSLSSAQNFQAFQHAVHSSGLHVVIWVLVSGLIYHIIAGIRHLLMDIHIGESLTGGRIGAWLVMLISAVLIVLFAIYIFS